MRLQEELARTGQAPAAPGGGVVERTGKNDFAARRSRPGPDYSAGSAHSGHRRRTPSAEGTRQEGRAGR